MSKSEGKRSLKAQGIYKNNAHCTASMIATSSKENTGVHVLLYKTHYGHALSLGHLRLTDYKLLAN